MVVKGSLQGEVENTFAPVVDFSTVRTVLTAAIRKGLVIQQMDVKTAFHHGDIDDDVYVSPRSGLDICRSGEVLKLRKGFYGLKEAPRLWNDNWKSIMDAMEFKALLSDECIFVKRDIWLLLYVDDIIVIGPSTKSIDVVKLSLHESLDVKDLNNCNPVTTPMCTNLFPRQNSADLPADRNMYQEMIGSLLFISTLTRPDISAAVGILCRYSSAPKQCHFIAVKRVLRYLKGTQSHVLLVRPMSLELVGYADANWGNDVVDRKLTTGALLQLGGCAIVWKTHKQNMVALSTSEAECFAASDAVKQFLWVRHLLKELGLGQVEPTILHQDNQGDIVLSTSGFRNAKHIAIRGNFMKSQVDAKTVKVAYCSTHDMIADILTKPLKRQAFERLRKALGIDEPSHPQSKE